MTANSEVAAGSAAADDPLIAVLEGIGDSFYAIDGAWRFTYFNRTAETYFGTPRASVLGRLVWDVFPWAEGSHLRRLMEHAMASRATVEVETDSVVVPGRFLQFRAFPYRDGLAIAFRDRTAEHAAREALAESEALFRTLAESLPQQVWIMRPDGMATYMNRRFREYHGIEIGPSREERGATIHPDDREAAFAVRATAMAAGEPFTVDVRTRRHDGEYRWQRMAVEPLRRDGKPISWIGTATDIDDVRRTQAALETSEARLNLLVSELNHRVKNVMAVAQAIANHTLRATLSVAEAKLAITGRFNALGAAVDLLTRSHWSGADMGELVALNLSGFSDRVATSGPPVMLTPRAAQTLSLVLYELASNAAKHGALSTPAGRVTIEWDDAASGSFRFAWREEDGPPVAAPAQRGFGLTLLERVAAAELGASVTLDYPGEGLRYGILAPADHIVASLTVR